MKKRVRMLLCVMLILFLAGCGAKLEEGEVYEKVYSPAHTGVRLFPQYFYNGKMMQTIMVPYAVHYHEAWSIKIRAYDETEEAWEKATYYVDEATYSTYEIGDIFRCEDVTYSEEPDYTKEDKKK